MFTCLFLSFYIYYVGTHGYIAQEFQNLGHMSESCDTYSLGVLILVVATGLPVYGEHEHDHVRDVVGDLLDDLKEQAVTLC